MVARERFVNWITGVPLALKDTISSVFVPTGDASGDGPAPGLVPSPPSPALNTRFLREDATWAIPSGISSVWLFAEDYDVLPANSAADNDAGMIDLIAAASNTGLGAVMMFESGTYNFSVVWPTLQSNCIFVQGQGCLSAGGTQLNFTNTTGDCITYSTSGHMGMADVYITSSVAKSAGFAVKITGGAYRPTFQNVRIEYQWNGFFLDNSSEARFNNIACRHLRGTTAFYAYGDVGGIFGWSCQSFTCDNPYNYGYSAPSATNLVAWTVATGYTQGDVVTANGNIYQCATTGTSAGAGTGPSGIPDVGAAAFTTTITDNTTAWVFVCSGSLTWVNIDSNSYSSTWYNCAFINGAYGWWLADTDNTGSSYPQWHNSFNLQCDHSYFQGVIANDGAGLYLSQPWIGSCLTGNGIFINTGFVGGLRCTDGRIVANAENGILLGGGVNNSIMGNEIYINSQKTNNTYDGILVSNNVSRFNIWNNVIGFGETGSARQRYGIVVGTGSDFFVCAPNNLLGNATAAFSNGSSGTATNFYMPGPGTGTPNIG